MRMEGLSKIGTVMLLVSTLLAPIPCLAETVGWRMDGDGRYFDTQPPVSWSPDDNVVWKAPMPSWSNASPILVPDTSLLVALSEPDEIFAIKESTGEIAWQGSVSDVSQEKISAHSANGQTSATPVSDGSHLYSVFGSGVVAAYDLKGKRNWARIVQVPEHRWGVSASPVLGGGNLIVHIVDLIALDPATGKEVWRETSLPKWGSPVVTRIAGTDVVITPGGDVFQAKDGKRIASEVGNVEYSTPVIQDGIAYFIEKKATAVKLPSSLDKPFETLWTSRLQGSRHYASPVIHDGLIYTASREESFSILDAKTGEVFDERRLDLGTGEHANSIYSSLSLAGDNIFLSAESGKTVVLEQGKKYKEIARNALDTFRSSPVFVGNRMYVRAGDHLYCFGPTKAKSKKAPKKASTAR